MTHVASGTPVDLVIAGPGLEDVLGMLRGRGDDLDIGTCRDTLRLLEEALDRSDLVSTLDGLVRDAG